MVKTKKIVTFILLIFFSAFLTFPVIKSGLSYSQGIGFWGANGHDGIWHLSLINNISNIFQIPMPSFSGGQLENYHPFFDILISVLNRLTSIPSSILLFQIFPIITSLLIVYYSFTLGKKLFGNATGGLLLTFFNCFATSAGWIYTLIKYGTLGGESLFWSMQSPSIQLNPPYALSILFILIILHQLLNLIESKSNSVKAYTVISILLILLPITKAYSAIFAFPIFGLFVLFRLSQKNYTSLIFLIFSFVAAVLLYFVYNRHSSSLLVFKPFWFVESLIESPDRFYLPQVANARYTLLSSGSIGPKLIAVYLFSIGVFYFGNLFTRIFGVFKLKLKFNFQLLILPSIIICLLIPLFFIQSGTPWNTIQFIYYALFFANLFLVNFLINLTKPIKYFIIATIVSLNFIPSLIASLHYLSPNAPTYITHDEVQALDFLSKQPRGTVLTYPYDKYARISIKTSYQPIWSYETTSYVPAYTQKPAYVVDYMNLINSDFDYQSRLDSSIDFFKFQNNYQDRGFLVNNQIDYLYLVNQQIQLKPENINNLYLSPLFQNSTISIYQVQR